MRGGGEGVGGGEGSLGLGLLFPSPGDPGPLTLDSSQPSSSQPQGVHMGWTRRKCCVGQGRWLHAAGPGLGDSAGPGSGPREVGRRRPQLPPSSMQNIPSLCEYGPGGNKVPPTPNPVQSRLRAATLGTNLGSVVVGGHPPL